MSLAEIIKALGGYRVVAEGLGLPPSTVYYWSRRGSIPAVHWPALLKLASELRRDDVTADTLVAAHRAAHDPAVAGDAA